MAYNRGKQFEDVVREAFEKVPGVSIDRLHDQTTGWKGSTNICDFIVYREPYEYYFECKSVHGNTLPFSNITDKQWQGMLEKSQIDGVYAGIICWFVDKDDTRFFPIQYLQKYKQLGCKSVAAFDESDDIVHPIQIKGKKKRVFFEYDMESLLNEIQHNR